MEKIVVNDTNIFIDLYKIGLLEEMFSLPWEIHTTRLVLVEIIREGQQESVNLCKLRNISALDNIEVHGILYIFDKMVEQKVLTPAIAADKLELLYSINHRLPKSEIDIRIKLWRGSL